MKTPQTKNPAPAQGILKFYNYSPKDFTGPNIDGATYFVRAGETLAMKENEARLMAKYLMEDYLNDAEIMGVQVTKDVGADPRREEYIAKALIDVDFTPTVEAETETEIIGLKVEESEKRGPGRPKKTEFPDLNESPKTEA